MQKLYEIYFPEGWEVYYGLIGFAVGSFVIVHFLHWMIARNEIDDDYLSKK